MRVATVAKNTGRDSVVGNRTPRGFLWIKYHGGLFGAIPKACWRLGWACPHTADSDDLGASS